MAPHFRKRGAVEDITPDANTTDAETSGSEALNTLKEFEKQHILDPEPPRQGPWRYRRNPRRWWHGEGRSGGSRLSGGQQPLRRGEYCCRGLLHVSKRKFLNILDRFVLPSRTMMSISQQIPFVPGSSGCFFAPLALLSTCSSRCEILASLSTLMSFSWLPNPIGLGWDLVFPDKESKSRFRATPCRPPSFLKKGLPVWASTTEPQMYK